MLGARVVQTWADTDLAAAALNALDKIDLVLPGDRRSALQATPLFAAAGFRTAVVEVDMGVIRRAIREHRRIAFDYIDAHGELTQRSVQPLGMFFFGATWLVGAWCELRDAFRAFRPDRMQTLELGPGFEVRPGRSLADFLGQTQDPGSCPG